MFFKEVNEVDLGETTIANIFIDIFMPMADGLYVKVYLLAYRIVCDRNNSLKYDNNSIARDLNIPLSDVISAWKFWEGKGLIKMHKNEGSNDFDYSIEFLDLEKLCTENILINTSSIKSNSDRIASTAENPSMSLLGSGLSSGYSIITSPLFITSLTSISEIWRENICLIA